MRAAAHDHGTRAAQQGTRAASSWPRTRRGPPTHQIEYPPHFAFCALPPPPTARPCDHSALPSVLFPLALASAGDAPALVPPKGLHPGAVLNAPRPDRSGIPLRLPLPRLPLPRLAEPRPPMAVEVLATALDDPVGAPAWPAGTNEGAWELRSECDTRTSPHNSPRPPPPRPPPPKWNTHASGRPGEQVGVQ